MQYAFENDLDVHILSAKYGFITPETVIERYDERRTTPYDGAWPEGRGYYLGGQVYFGKAPERFKTLIPGCTSQGALVAKLSSLVTAKPPKRLRPTMARGKNIPAFPVSARRAYNEGRGILTALQGVWP